MTASRLSLALMLFGFFASCALASLPSPSCMLNNESCPIPRGWDVDWSVINSTAMMAARESPDGLSLVNHWGYVTLDWQAGWRKWLHADPRDDNCEATSAANCAALKASGKVKRCGIYHNMELALEWLESERAVMDAEHVKKGWFLTFKNGSVFNTPRTEEFLPGNPWPNQTMAQWIIDWRNPEAAAYFVSAILNATFLEGVDATFTDDLPGVPAEHPEVQPNTGLSNESLAELQFATQINEGFLATSLAVAGKFCWDCVGGEDGPEGTGYSMEQVPPPNTTAGCVAWFKKYCKPEMQGRGMFMDWDMVAPTDPHAWRMHAREQTLASFLITRGPFAFIGSRNLRDNTWHPLFATDVGEPLGLCYEEPKQKNVFSRKWSKGVASLDCNSYTASLPFGSLSL